MSVQNPLAPVSMPDRNTAPRVWESVEPSDGKASLTFFQEPFAKPGPHITLHIKASPWQQTGKQPFSWSYNPPMGRHTYGTLRIVLARGAVIYQTGSLGKNEKRIPIGGTLNSLIYDEKNPFIEIIRPQNENLIPAPEDPIDPHRVVGMSWREEPFFTTRSPGVGFHSPRVDSFPVSAITRIGVVPSNRGVSIRNLHGFFHFKIEIERLDQPAAFAYDISTYEETSGLSLFVNLIYTTNIKVAVEVHEDLKKVVGIFAKKVSHTRHVPQQGSEIKYDASLKYVEPDHIIYKAETQMAIIGLEVVIGLIPFVGVLYDIAQLAYQANTGKNFWGQRISEVDMVILGTMIVLPMGSAASSTTRSVTKIAKARGVAKALEKATVANISQVVDSAFIDAVGTITPKAHKKLFYALEKYHLGKISYKALLSEYDQVLGKAYLVKLEDKLLSKAFTRNFQGFSDPQLAQGYQRYLSQPKFRDNPKKAADPASWAKQQNKVKNSRYLGRLQQILGEEYVSVIDRAIKGGKIPRSVTDLDIRNYDKLIEKYVTDYDELRQLSKALNKLNPEGARVGDHFELDHLLEQRFWRNNNRLTSAFDEKGLGAALVVPKTEYVAAEIFRKFGGKRLRYVHATKTRMLKRLIPHGSEAIFAHHFGAQYVQNLWYAHAHVLRSLGTEPSVLKAMSNDFALMAEELGQQFSAKIPKPDMFLHKNGWPRIWEDPNQPGLWNIVASTPGVTR